MFMRFFETLIFSFFAITLLLCKLSSQDGYLFLKIYYLLLRFLLLRVQTSYVILFSHFKSLFAKFRTLQQLSSFVLQLCYCSFKARLCLLKLFLVFDCSFSKILYTILLFALVDVNFLTTDNSQISSCLVNQQAAHLCKNCT